MTEYEEPEAEAPKAKYSKADLEALGQKWLERIRLSEEREQHWRDSAEKAENAYLAGCNKSERDSEAPEFNIIHSNVETIVPSIYNSAGKPDIRARHNNTDPIAKVVSDILERAIMTQIDDSAMAAEVEASAQDTFVAGRGIVRVKFDADVQGEQVQGERVEYEVVAWDDFRMGAAKKWKDVPWVAIRHTITQEALEEVEDKELADLQVDPDAVKSDDDVTLWEIWCKRTRKVYFIVGENHKVLSVKDDPLGLKRFFPVTTPIQPITATNSMTPVCPYEIYKTLADELDMITRRIRGLTEVLKAKGIYAGTLEDLDALATADDGELVGLPDMEGIVAQGGLERAIMWWPVEKIIVVIRELVAQREQTKQAIYEITGISDIIRGQSSASETATAQQIKTQWGSLRIKKMQRLIERQVRELFIITAEIISSKFTIPTLQMISGMQIPPEAMPLLQKPLDHYRIDVESDSTIRADLESGRREMAEFLQGTAQFFSSMAPIVAQAPQAAGPVVEMYSSFARQFNLGKQAEDALDQFAQIAKQAAENPPPNPEAEAMQAEQQAKAQEMQANMQVKGQELQLKGAEMQQKGQISQAELALKEREIGLKESELALRAQEIAISRESAGVDNAVKQGQVVSGLGAMGEQLVQMMAQAFGPIIQQMQEQQAMGLQAIMAEIQSGNQAVIASINAPNEIVRGEDGRAMGTRKAMVQ
jgi:hypothetical protein